MAYKGGSKPKKAKVLPTPTEYDNVKSSTFSGPFGSGTSGISDYTDPVTGQVSKQITANATLNPALQESADLAQSGLSANLGYINRNPEEQVAYATGGQDPVYNVLREQAQRAFDENLGRLRLTAFKGGGLNSTAAGSAYGNLAYNKNLYDNQILQSSLQFGNQQATQNVGTNLGAIGGLANLVYPLSSAANSQLNTALQANDRADAQTISAINAANAQHTAAMNQYNAQKQASLGQMIGGGLGLIGTLGGAMLGNPAGLAGIFNLGGTASNTPFVPSGSSGVFGSTLGLPNWNNFSTNLGGSYYGSPNFTNLAVI